MFISITKPERDNFLSQTNDCLIPGYTGHCPTLKFKVGKRYGANTKEIIKELNEKGTFKSHQTCQYRESDPLKKLLDDGDFRPIERIKGQKKEFLKTGKDRSRPYILGYTGFIPGLNYRYGKSYGAAADESLKQYYIERELTSSKKSLDKNYRNKMRSFPKMQSHVKDEKLKDSLMDFDDENKITFEHISAECPPVTGYTGHIPRIRSSDASLSKNYHVAAKRGLYLHQQEREKLKNLNNIQQQIERSQSRMGDV